MGALLFVRRRFGKDARARLIDKDSGVRLRPPGEGRTDYLTPGQIVKVSEAAADWWLPIRLTITTGLRRSALLRLKVKDLLVDTAKLVVRHGKSRHARRDLPLDGEMIGMLRGWIAAEGIGPEGRVCGFNKHQLRKAWDEIRELTGVPHIRWHDLRHTYAAYCAMAGMPLTTLRQRLGVGSLGLVQRYAAYADDSTDHEDAARSRMGLSTDPVPTDVPTAAPEPESAEPDEARKSLQGKSGGAGIRTLKPLRAPHFECGRDETAGTDESRRSRRQRRFGRGGEPQ